MELLRSLTSKLDDHLTDDRMASLVCDELPFGQRFIAKRHLARCWRCRLRKEDLEGCRADRMIRLYREAIDEQEQLSTIGTADDFLEELQLEIRNAAPRRRWGFRFPRLPLPEFALARPALVACMLLTLCSAIFFFWWQQRPTNISSNALLARAERWDTTGPAMSSGVVFQAVRVTTRNQTMERPIYRDIQGKRVPRHAKLAAKEDLLRNTLVKAGLDWDEPISASSYQRWHDRQYVHQDRITRAGNHLLALTTTVPAGSISEQSLTVRDTDFHPVQRTVVFRDSQTIEVAELDFKILSWSSVDASLFEPIGDASPILASNPELVRPLPSLSETVTDEQLDETELEARLVLNTLGADTGEQIQIGRIPQGVEVRGLVDTDERKRALQKHLQAVPHLKVSIQSIADVQNNLSANDAVREIKAASMPDQPSPLEKYLLARGRSVIDINVLAHRLFENALTISQESKAIADLRTRFASAERQSVVASAALSELIYSHHERLVVALNQERELLRQLQGSPGIHRAASTPQSALTDAALKLLTLCQELTQSNSPDTRKTDAILSEMSDCVKDLTSDLQQAYAQPGQGDSPFGGKR